MKYTFKNWIQTEHWEGALIQDENGKEFLTSGINKWEPNGRRQYIVVDTISNKDEFNRRWEEFNRFDKLIFSEDIKTITAKHLEELGAFEVPNPTFAKMITMRRLLDAGYSDNEAYQAIKRVFVEQTI